ncbi:MAG TPA: hypothetical protein VGX91_09085 [Candidatus Cybelea sp.]|jgi:hypothetical protein|nr:hypothetical protein [Candidatus Cybelea sp.]
MKPRARRFVPLVAAAALVAAIGYGAVALAAVDMSAGIRYVSPTGTADECSTKAKAALEAYLPGATETSPGSGEWIATAQNPVVGVPTAAATVRCYGLSKGYVATFICSVQLPTNPYAAGPLCLDIAHKFYGGAITPLAAMPTPTPVPSGCSTSNLVGTWVSDDSPSKTFTMGLNGDVTDSDGVSGNWALDGSTVTFTYYGNHTLTLSADGKHLHGGGYSLTRKC